MVEFEAIKFFRLSAARDWQDKHGGWIFVSDGDCAFIIWFAPFYTPSEIMQSQLTRGISGKLS